MPETEWIRRHAALSLDRLWPRLEQRFAGAPVDDWRVFETRLRGEWERLFGLLVTIYGQHYDLFYHLEELLAAAARSWLERPTWLKQRDTAREADPLWFQSQQMVGGVLYVDSFDGTLARLHQRIPYFKQLGLTYVHLMPLFEAPEGESDGGYAVSSYRRVNPALGTIEELSELARALAEQDISLVVAFVFQHTSDELAWARRAQAGGDPYVAS
jgi:amylosucrase